VYAQSQSRARAEDAGNYPTSNATTGSDNGQNAIPRETRAWLVKLGSEGFSPPDRGCPGGFTRAGACISRCAPGRDGSPAPGQRLTRPVIPSGEPTAATRAADPVAGAGRWAVVPARTGTMDHRPGKRDAQPGARRTTSRSRTTAPARTAVTVAGGGGRPWTLGHWGQGDRGHWATGHWGTGHWGTGPLGHWATGPLGTGPLGSGLADDFDGAYVALASAQDEEAVVQQVVRAGNRVL
jgi:hypothetical protein